MTPTQPPQGVMAPAEALAAIDEAIGHLLDREICDTERAELALAFFKRLIAEVEALQAENALLRSDAERIASCPWRVQKGATALCQPPKAMSALLARCEGLEAALREIVAIDPRSDAARLVAIGQARKFAIAALAATRTTGD